MDTGRRGKKKGKLGDSFQLTAQQLTGTVKITVIEMIDFIVENSGNELFLKIGKVHS